MKCFRGRCVCSWFPWQKAGLRYSSTTLSKLGLNFFRGVPSFCCSKVNSAFKGFAVRSVEVQRQAKMISGLQPLLSSKSLFPIFIWSSAADSEFLWLFLLQIKVLHKLSADISTPGRLGAIASISAFFSILLFLLPVSLEQEVGGSGAELWGALAVPCPVSLPSLCPGLFVSPC